MNPDFWHARWEQGQIGFHQNHVNAYLQRHQELLFGGKRGLRVLVPLCGKSVDMTWIARLGHGVLGVELSRVAAHAYYAERQLFPSTRPAGPFVSYTAGGVEILCGDMFALDRGRLGHVDAVFDRAALVALPEHMRARYVRVLEQLLAPGTRMLLVTFEHASSTPIAGPPFSVDEAQVRALYTPGFEVTFVERQDISDSEPRFKQRGMQHVQESVFSLVRR